LFTYEESSIMGTAERREREREQLRSRIVEAARDILSEQGLAALSMRAIAERIEYSPATIYLYFKDKNELEREVVREGFALLWDRTKETLAALPGGSNALEQYAAMGRAYVRFALENTAYFRVMFELPGGARFESEDCPGGEHGEGSGFSMAVDLVNAAAREGLVDVTNAERTAVTGWALLHGLTSLYLSGHLGQLVETNESFLELVEDALQSFYTGVRGPEVKRASQSAVKPARATQAGRAGRVRGKRVKR
jgi:AcrR family transcriptional regulator